MAMVVVVCIRTGSEKGREKKGSGNEIGKAVYEGRQSERENRMEREREREKRNEERKKPFELNVSRV